MKQVSLVAPNDYELEALKQKGFLKIYNFLHSRMDNILSFSQYKTFFAFNMSCMIQVLI